MIINVKTRFLALLFIPMLMGLNSCKKDEIDIDDDVTIDTPVVELAGNETLVTHTEVTVFAEVTEDGGGTVSSRGFIYGLVDARPDTVYCKGDAFSVRIEGLTPNTTYRYSAFARNEAGMGHSETLTFTTLDYALPTVSTAPIENITTGSATGGGEVINDGDKPVTERGICWSLEHDPTIDDAHVAAGEGVGVFVCEMTGLEPNTYYYVRAYATNEKGTAYGEEIRFVTDGGALPEVVTKGVSDITLSTALGSGNVVSDGGATVTERGLCWSINHNPTLNDTHGNSGTGLGNFTISMSGLAEGTTYYVRAYATNSVGTSYGDEVGFTTSTTWGNGALAGLFSVNGGQQVRFSQGNLQYQASTNTWRFASNQYDFVGQNNSQLSSSYSGWIDLFGWGTSGYNHGAVCWQPWSSSAVWSHYYAYGSYYYHLYDQSGQADWGYNAISNGGNQTQRWRTLTKEEWMYVFEQRTTATGNRFAKAQVNGVNGVVLLPDNWSVSVHPLNECNNVYVPFETNVVSSSIWSTMEANGAVFLPAAGYRSETEVFSVGVEGNYWSASYADDYDAYYMSVISTNLMPNNVFGRDFGRSVRLVCPAK